MIHVTMPLQFTIKRERERGREEGESSTKKSCIIANDNPLMHSGLLIIWFA